MTSSGSLLEPTHLSTWLRRDLRWLLFMCAHTYKHAWACFSLRSMQTRSAKLNRIVMEVFIFSLFIDIWYTSSNVVQHTDTADILLKRLVIGKNVSRLFMSKTLMFNRPSWGFSIAIYWVLISSYSLLTMQCFSIGIGCFSFSLYVRDISLSALQKYCYGACHMCTSFF